MGFLIYDLIFLVAFLIFISTFLYSRRKNLKREGLLFLYRTKWGIKIINYLGNKYKRTLNVLSYLSIITGYLLVVGVLYMIYTVLKVYLFNPAIVQAIKVPPIIPLVPYLPQIFKLEFLPPFYFTYWIVILAVIAITHEMAHGIFAARDKVKIKTTGFGFFPWFLPIFLAAFVELDEKAMAKKKKFPQLAILSAGTFANVLTAIFFLVILFGFFSVTFAPSGVIFDSYATSALNISGISMINGIALTNVSYEKILNYSNETGLNKIRAGSQNYLVTKKILEDQRDNEGIIIIYDDAPAINANLSSIITEINGVEVDSIEKLQVELGKYMPGENITLATKTEAGFQETELTLGENR